MVKARFKWIEIFHIIFGVLLLSLILATSPPLEINFIPNAVTALTTLAGILTTFIGFWLTHTYSNLKDEETKKWMSNRIKAIVFIIGNGLLFVMGSSIYLVRGWLEIAFKLASFGTLIILAALMYTMSMITLREIFEE